MHPETRGPEGSRTSRSRWKLGLETPIEGRLWRESRLIFAPHPAYDWLTWGCIVFGAWCLLAIFVPVLNFAGLPPLPESVRIWMGPAVFFAGLWGQLSSERMTIDLRKKTYARREGQGVFKRIIRGSVSELDAVVALTEVSALYPGAVIYRLVLYWKGNRWPLLILDRQNTISTGGQLNSSAGTIVAKGARYAQLLQISFYDNTYFASPEPLRPI